MARRNWKNLFQTGGGLSPQVIVQMESLEDDLQGVAAEPFAPASAASILARPRTFLGGTANAASTLAAGHGWTTSGGDASTNLNYTGDAAPPNSAQCIRLVSNGAGAAAVTSCPRAPAFDATGKCVVLQLKVEAANASHLTALSVYIGSGASAFLNFVSQQIVGYNGTSGDYGEMAQPGEWFTVSMPVMSFQTTTGTIDWTQIQDVRVRIVDDNTANKAAVLVGGAWFATQDTVRYPNGVVSITFDDLWATQYTAAMPKMLQYGYRGSLFAIHDTLDNTAVGYMTSAQLATLRELGWGVYPHAYSLPLHNQANGFAGMSAEAIADDWLNLRRWLTANTWVDAPVYAWPQGKQDTVGLLQARRTWAAARTICNRAMESVPPADPYRIKCISVGSTTAVAPNSTVGGLEWLVDRTYSYGGWLVVCFHKIVPSATTSLECSTANFGTFIDYLASKPIPVATINEVLQVPGR